MRKPGGPVPSFSGERRVGVGQQWAEFRGAPLRLRAYLLVLGAVAATLALTGPGREGAVDVEAAEWLTVVALLGSAAAYIESARLLATRFEYQLQPNRAVAAWALATVLLLPTGWLLVVVPLTMFHASRRDPAMAHDFRWVPAALELVVCGVVASLAYHALVRGMIGSFPNGVISAVVGALVAGAAFLFGEWLFWLGARLLDVSGVRWWVRGRRAIRGGVLAEAIVLLAGVQFVAVWAVGPWFALFAVTASLLTQLSLLVLPLRARLAAQSRLVAENHKLASLVDTLASKNSELDEQIRFKTDLMSMLGHEISNPLTSVLGFSQIGLAAATEEDSAAARSSLVIVERNARKVADVVFDIRQLVASDQGGITAVPESVLLEPRLRAVIDDRSRSRRPELSCAPGLSVCVQPGHLDQIVANLLSNAEKYAGGATTVCALEHPDRQFVALAVLDSGSGIPDASRARLFDRYWREAATAGNVPGTGIGLYISRELARANGGDLIHEHAEPSGSRFVLTLPRA